MFHRRSSEHHYVRHPKVTLIHERTFLFAHQKIHISYFCPHAGHEPISAITSIHNLHLKSENICSHPCYGRRKQKLHLDTRDAGLLGFKGCLRGDTEMQIKTH